MLFLFRLTFQSTINSQKNIISLHSVVVVELDFSLSYIDLSCWWPNVFGLSVDLESITSG